MSEHATGDELALYVIDGLEGERAAAVEEHVRGCARCAAALAREARLELELGEVARAPRAISRRWARPAIAAAVSAFACAAALALWIASRPAVVAPLPITVTCIEATDEAACVAAAERQGLVPQFPPGARARFDRDDDGARMDNRGE